MQIFEVSGKEIYRLTAVDHRPESNDMNFLNTVVRHLKPHDFLEFRKTHRVIYPKASREAAQARVRHGIDFKSTCGRILTLEATDHADFKVRKGFQEISLHITRGNPLQVIPETARGIYIYDTGFIQDDPRHHLNGPFVDICFAFCSLCFEAPIIDRMMVSSEVCADCSRLSAKELLELRRYKEKLRKVQKNKPKSWFERIRKFVKIEFLGKW